MLRDAPLPAGWQFESAEVRRRFVVARYRSPDGIATELRLEHPDTGVAADRRTARFAIRGGGTGGGDALLDAVVAGISAHEGRWRWIVATAPGVDLELAALLAGAKPGVRIRTDPDAADETLARYRAAGAAALALGRVLPIRGEASAIVYAARDEFAVAALRASEAALFDALERRAPPSELAALHRRLGAQLGYPVCCVEAFLPRMMQVDGADDMFRAVTDAWVARPRPRLNNLLFAQRLGWISFEPCSYACDAAVHVADAIAAAVDPDVRRARDQPLARPVLVHSTGMRAWIELDAARRRIVAATPLARRPDAAVDPRDAAVAAGCVGARVDDRGLVRIAGRGSARLVDFGLSSQAR